MKIFLCTLTLSNVKTPSFSLFVLTESFEEYILKDPNSGKYACVLCNFKTRNHCSMVRHVKARHIKAHDLPCSLCNNWFSTPDYRQRHYKNKHRLNLTAKQIADMTEFAGN